VYRDAGHVSQTLVNAMRESRKMPPVHPGAILRNTVLPALKLNVTDFADKLGVSRTAMSRLIHEHSRISPDMARRLGIGLGNGYHVWMRLQADYDIWHAGLKPMPKIKKLSTPKS
jgi:antitoxin HigA-1